MLDFSLPYLMTKTVHIYNNETKYGLNNTANV